MLTLLSVTCLVLAIMVAVAAVAAVIKLRRALGIILALVVVASATIGASHWICAKNVTENVAVTEIQLISRKEFYGEDYNFEDYYVAKVLNGGEAYEYTIIGEDGPECRRISANMVEITYDNKNLFITKIVVKKVNLTSFEQWLVGDSKSWYEGKEIIHEFHVPEHMIKDFT